MTAIPFGYNKIMNYPEVDRMKGHFLTIEDIQKFREYLREDEKSENTLIKYISDITAFSGACGGAVTKYNVIA